MKNRKLFAILTLVAFMLTLAPVMAFGAVSGASSNVFVETSSATVTDGDKVKALEFVLDLNDELGEGQSIYVWTTRNGVRSDGERIFLEDPEDVASPEEVTNGEITEIATDGSIFVTSTEEGEVVLHVVVGPAGQAIKNIINNSDEAEFYNIGTAKGTFKEKSNTSDKVITELKVTDKDGKTVASDVTTDKYGNVEEAEFSGLIANSGVNYYKVTMTIKKGNSKLAGEDFTISTNKSGVMVSKETATANASSQIKFNVSASKAGEYTITVDGDDFSEEIVFIFDAATINSVKATTVTTQTLAVDATAGKGKIKWSFYDNNGNELTYEQAKAAWATEGDKWEIVYSSVPEDSDIETDEVAEGLDFAFRDDDMDIGTSGIVPDVAGTYTIKAYNQVGASAYATFKAADFGKVTKAAVTYSAKSYTIGTSVKAPVVDIFDADGTVRANNKKISFSYSGSGIKNFDSNTGAFTVINDDKYVGNVITVTAVIDKTFTVVNQFTITDVAAALSAEDVVAEVGGEGTLTFYVVDNVGNKTAFGKDWNGSVDYEITVTGPAGSHASADIDNDAKVGQKGQFTVKAASDVEGPVTVNVLMTVTDYYKNDDNSYDDLYLAGEAVVNFGAAAVVDPNASLATLFIDKTTYTVGNEVKTSDAAPYIATGRTMVPVRVLSDILGADINYADGVVTIVANGKTVTMTLGSNVMTVDGVAQTLDVTVQSENGRVYLPLRAAATVFGHSFEVIYNANGSVNAVAVK